MAASALEEERKIPFGDVGLAVLGVWVSLFLLFSLSKGLSG
jgi:hypothetical protein